MSYSHQEFQLIKKKIADLSNSNPNWKAMGWQYKYTNGERTGDVGITLIVEKKLPLNEIKGSDVFPQSITIPGVSEPVKTDVQEGVTNVRACIHEEDELTKIRGFNDKEFCHHFPHQWFNRFREDSWLLPVSAHKGIHRPVVGGISLGTIPPHGYSFLNDYKKMSHGTGTLGGLCIDRDDNTVVGISNNHVIGKMMLIGNMNTDNIENDEPHAAYTSNEGLTYYSFLCANDTTPSPNETRYPVYQRSFADNWKAHHYLYQPYAATDVFEFNGTGKQKSEIDKYKIGTVKRVYPLSLINNKIDVAIFALEQPDNNTVVIHNWGPYISGANTRMISSGSNWSKGSSNTTLTYTTTDDEWREADGGAVSQRASWYTVLNVKSGGTTNQYVELAPSHFVPGALKASTSYKVSFWYKWISKSEKGKVTLGGESVAPDLVYPSVNLPYSRDGLVQAAGKWYVYEARITVQSNTSEGLRIYLNTDSGSTDDELIITKVHLIEDPDVVNGNNFVNTLFDKDKSWKQLNLARQDEDMADSVQGVSAMGFATTAEIDSLKAGGVNEGAPVFKSGRTTGPIGYPGSANTTAVCQLSVADVVYSATVGYGEKIAKLGFVNQLKIRGKDNQPVATEDGDSGSFWYALFNEGNSSLSAWKVIGLNFAGGDSGSGRFAVANRIDNISEMFRLSAYRGEDLDIGYKNVDIKVVNSRSDAVTATIGGQMYWQAGSTNAKSARHNPANGRVIPSPTYR